jgi:hypothetical protein
MRKKPVHIVYDYEVDDAPGYITTTLQDYVNSKNCLIYERNSLDTDLEEAKELARAAGKSTVLIVENDNIAPSKIYTKNEIEKIANDLQAASYIAKTVKELVEIYLSRHYIPKIELLRLIGTPSVILCRYRKFLSAIKDGTFLRTSPWSNELIKSFTQKTGFKGRTYLEITLQDGRKLRESKGKYGSYLSLI